MRRTLTACVVVALALAGCGDDDDDTATTDDATTEAPATTEAAATTEAEPSAAGPSEAFCDAYDGYLDAQDGAQLNTALGTMTSELPEDAPAEVGDALVTLSTGDQAAEDYATAGATLEAWAGPACETG